MKVKDVMHPGVNWVNPNVPVSELAKKMRQADVGALPVGENDRLIGMVTDRDIVCRGLADGRDIESLSARDVMSKGIIYCYADDDLETALKTMTSKRLRRLPVIDTNKRMIGMLSIGDISQQTKPEHCAQVMRAVAAHHP